MSSLDFDSDNTILIVLAVILLLLFLSNKRTDTFANCKNFDANLAQKEIQQYYEEIKKQPISPFLPRVNN